jgi:hypothetical protein
MKTILTCISEGYLPLIETFCKANEIDATLDSVKTDKFNYGSIPKITISYEENSDTADTLAFLALKHCSVENMLCHYLMRCGINENAINFGKMPTKSATDEEYEAYKKSRRAEHGWTINVTY